MTMKKCSNCKAEHDIDKFRRDKSREDGHNPQCKECDKEYQEATKEAKKTYNRAYYLRTKEEQNRKSKEYRENHKEELAEYQQKWRDEHKEYTKNYNKNYRPIAYQKRLDKYHNDDEFRVSFILRTKIPAIIKGNEKYSDFIGCSPNHLRKWLEFQFEPDMNWDNLGSMWEIDHILPISKFDLTKELDRHVCFRWTNLQPLVKEENRSKSAKLLLHYYFNSVISVHRFIQNEHLDISEYQAIDESRLWLREKLRYGNNLSG